MYNLCTRVKIAKASEKKTARVFICEEVCRLKVYNNTIITRLTPGTFVVVVVGTQAHNLIQQPQLPPAYTENAATCL